MSKFLTKTKEPEKRELSDEELLSLSVREDPERFAEIIRRYQEGFFRKARYILKTDEDAEDAVQESFVKIYVHGASFKKKAGASFQSWGYRILINTCLTSYRKKVREKTYMTCELDETLLEFANYGDIEQNLSKDTFLSVLSRMPVQMASVLRNLVLFGKSLKDVAQLERVSVGAIRTRLHRARKVFERVYATVR